MSDMRPLSERAGGLTADQQLELKTIEHAMAALGVQVTPPTEPGGQCTIDYVSNGRSMFSHREMELMRSRHVEEKLRMHEKMQEAIRVLGGKSGTQVFNP